MATRTAIAKTQTAFLLHLFLFILIFSFIPKCYAASIYPVPHLEGDTFRISIDVDSVTALAGLKISISYDKNAMKYIEATKTQATSSLMHIVNDKTPGKLIIVMAGAKGISGENISLINLIFKSLQGSATESAAAKIEEAQFMDENLKDIQVTILQKRASGKNSAGGKK